MAILKKGQNYAGGTVEYDTATGNPLLSGQTTVTNDALPVTPTTQTPITSETIGPASSFNVQQPVESPIPDITGLDAQIKAINEQFAPLPQQENLTAAQKRIMELTNQTSQENAVRSSLEADPALEAKRQTVRDLSSQVSALIAENNAIPLRIQQEARGKGVTTGGIAPIQTAQLRENAIKALSTSALLSAAQGNLTLALDQVDRSVKAQFEKPKAELEALLKNYDVMLKDPSLTQEQQRRAAIAKAKTEARQKEIATQEKNMETLHGLILQAQENGAPPALTAQALKDGTIFGAGQLLSGWLSKETDVEIRRYNEAKKTGFKGSFLDYQKELERAKLLGKAPTTVKSALPSTVNNQGQYKSDLDAMVGNTFNLITSKFGQESFANTIKSARNDSDKLTAIATIALGKATADERKDFVSQAQGVKNIEKAIAILDEGIRTGRVEQGKQYVYNLAGRDFDPKLAQLNQYITSAIQPYRSSITGAAWGEQEDAEYQQLFGSSGYTPEALKTRLLGLKDILTSKSSTALQAYVSPLGVFGGEKNQFEGEMNDPYGSYRSQLGSDEILVNRNGRMMAVTQDELLDTDEQL